jgi:hypothetical protein
MLIAAGITKHVGATCYLSSEVPLIAPKHRRRHAYNLPDSSYTSTPLVVLGPEIKPNISNTSMQLLRDLLQHFECCDHKRWRCLVHSDIPLSSQLFHS